ncbi:MAG: prepilin-type N-terminal cleavage/methylation domain-containing protein [Gemmatimonadota bacterium]|nr:prepilin-type N-terminal cleavage/methylation domain-containing protein [Gemmatimonadota bacterium]
MNRRIAFSARGQTLVELMIALLVLAVIGTGMTRLMVWQSRYFDQLLASRNARAVSRGALTLMLSELHMVDASDTLATDTSALISASATEVTLRVPFALGVVCQRSAGLMTMSLLPTDSLAFANAEFSGFAWRDTVSQGQPNRYHYVEAGAALHPGTAAACAAAGITTLPGGRVADVTPGVPTGGPAGVPVVGAPIMLEQQVKYSFAPSSAVPGAVALWRTLITNGSAEEVAAPFDSSARFHFYVGNDPTPQAAAPAVLATIRGLGLQLDAVSERPPQSAARPERAPVTTAVFFHNRIQ